MPARRQHVAAALAGGLLDLHVAAAIARTIGKVAPGLTPVELEELERQLVARAQEGYTADEFLTFLRTVPDYAWPDGAGERESQQSAAASVGKRKLDNGLTRWTLDLDALTSGFFETALDANTAKRRFSLELDDGAHLDDQDRRPLARRRVDGIRLIAKNILKLDDGQLAGTAVTLLVTMTEDALKTGLGTALLPGCQETISAATARMLAADAEVVPVVLGGKSQVLDLGTGRRFFSEPNAGQWRSATGVARDRAAMHRCPGATPRTSDPPATDPPRSTTGSCCAGDATSCSTRTDGRSTARSTTAHGGGPRHPGSTPPHAAGPAGPFRLLASTADLCSPAVWGLCLFATCL